MALQFDKTTATEQTESQGSARLNRWLEQLVALKGSDLLLVAEAAAAIRVEGALQEIEGSPLSGPEIEAAVLPCLPPHALENYRQDQIADSSYRVPGLGRFRINLHHERGRAAAAVRALPAKVPSLAELNLPAGVAAVAELQRGLVIIGGATGSGKTTTLAAW
jgi:Tfp pilus assembly pilus retraction ATPase PilT